GRGGPHPVPLQQGDLVRLGDMARFAKGEMWLTPRYEEYVTGKRSVAAERDALVQIMTRPKRVRTETFSASGAGQCPRRRQLAYLGMPQKKIDPKSANIFANGDYMHLRHQVAGLLSGYLVAAEHFVTNEE